MRFLWVLSTAAWLSAAVLLPRSAQAQQANQQSDEVSATGKGIVGGALLGGEAVMLTEAALSVKPKWAYIVGGLAGAIGGGVGGYFAEQEGSPKLSLYLLAGGMALMIPTTVAVLSATAYEVPADYTQDRAPSDEPVAEPPQTTPATLPGSNPAPEPSTPASPEPGSLPSEPATPPAALPPPTSTPPTSTPPSPAPSTTAPPPQGRAPLPRRIDRATADLHRPVSHPAIFGLGRGSLTLSIPAIEVSEAFTPKERAQFGLRQTTLVRVPVFSARF